MVFVCFGLNSSTDPYISTGDKRIILTHPSVSADSLILTEISEYNPNWEGWLTSQQRTLAGSLTIAGRNRPPARESLVSCIVTENQLKLFEELKGFQDFTLTPITIQDYFKQVQYNSSYMTSPSWLSGYPLTDSRGKSYGFISMTVFVDIDASYATYISHDWYNLQFTVKAV